MLIYILADILFCVLVILTHIYIICIYTYWRRDFGSFGPRRTLSRSPPKAAIGFLPKPSKKAKNGHFYPPPKKWVPAAKNGPQGRPRNPIFPYFWELISL